MYWSRPQLLCFPNPLFLLLLHTSCWVGAPLPILSSIAYCNGITSFNRKTVVPHRTYPTNVLVLYEIWLHVDKGPVLGQHVFYGPLRAIAAAGCSIGRLDWMFHWQTRLAAHAVGWWDRGRQVQSPPPCVWAHADSANVISVTQFLLSA